MRIEMVTEETLESVLPLIAAYQESYGAEPNHDRNRSFFGQFAGGDNPVGVQFLAIEGATAVGFATLYFLPSSTTARSCCLLNDLFTVTEHRGKGIGRALILHCKQYASAHGYGGIEWQTRESNKTAQRLYDSLGASRSSWYTYSL